MNVPLACRSQRSNFMHDSVVPVYHRPNYFPSMET
jgi:hypothetical protein